MAGISSMPLGNVISVAAVLTGTENKTSQSPNIAAVLKSRLVRTYEMLGEGHDDMEDAALDELRYITAKVSLRLVERVQSILDPVDSDMYSDQAPPPLGARDLSHIRTLLSIIFKWAIRPLSIELELHRPGPSAPTFGEPQIIDLTRRRLDSEELPSLLSRLLYLIFGTGTTGKIRQTWVTTSIINHHTVDLLTPAITLGWLPRPTLETFNRTSKDIKPLSVRFISLLRPDQAIAALGAILSSATNSRVSFTHVPKVCAHLLTNQLKRPNGVRGLCVAILGGDTDDVEAAPLEKLEHIATVLRTVPSTSKPEAYYQFMVPNILELLLPALSEQTPPSHKRAAAFALTCMISPTFQHNAIASSALLPLLHEPFLSSNARWNEDETAASPATMRRWRLTPVDVLKTLQSFLLYMDPSPSQVSTLITPIVPELYTLLTLHYSSKTVDPTIRESLDALLNTWGRIVGSSDVIDSLWSVIHGTGGSWELGLEGFTRSTKPASEPSISLLVAANLERVSKDDIDINANPFNLRPDPSAFVGFLKSLNRKDVASEIFVRLLNEYRKLKETESDPMRTLLHLQLILQMQSQLSSTILSKPEHVLSFIKHALVSKPQRPSSQARMMTQKKGLGLEDLRIGKKEEDDEGDSDDEDDDERTEQPQNRGGRDEMVVTAITLLLSILEGNSDMSPNTTPDLYEILVSLENLTSHTAPAVRQIAREARLVLTARTASTSSTPSVPTTRPTEDIESAQAKYQKALKLLQDPIIPVRAHGLQLLRDLVSRPPGFGPRVGQTGNNTPLLDPALVPGILSIFLQSIQDDDSYLFLNAVQGLAAMVDGYGKDVLSGIVDIYLNGTGVRGSGGLGGTIAMSKEDLNMRVRVGEALNIAVKRCGNALGLYIDLLIPPLLTILRSSHLPAILRTSALAILAQCVGTYAPALTTHTSRLVDACIELIQLESVVSKNLTETREKRETKPFSGKVGAEDESSDGSAKSSLRRPEPTDVDPVTKDTKVAPFRRSALHFLSQLLRSHTAIIYNARPTSLVAPDVTLNIEASNLRTEIARDSAIPQSLLKRAAIVLEYVAATDEDSVTRVMAREASEFVEQYREASLGF